MPEPNELLTEVFASGRLAILQALEAEPLRFSEVAKRLKVSESEVSRNLNRLLGAGLVAKQPKGAFDLTPSARIALEFLPPISFVARHQEYINAHAIARVPPEFLRRINDLLVARLVKDPFTIYGHLEHMFRTLERRFDGQWIIGKALGHQQLELHRLAMQRLQETGATARTVMLRREMPAMLKQSPGFLEVFETRLLDAAPTSVAVTERAAVVWFDDLAGHLDFNQAFVGDHPQFVGWAQELFEHYWARAEPASGQPPAPGKKG
jgi:predicted transcriptional regulator